MQNNSFSLCGILEFQSVLRQKQCLTAVLHAQERLAGASCFPLGNPFTVNYITYSRCGHVGVSNANQTSHDVGTYGAETKCSSRQIVSCYSN